MNNFLMNVLTGVVVNIIVYYIYKWLDKRDK